MWANRWLLLLNIYLKPKNSVKIVCIKNRYMNYLPRGVVANMLGGDIVVSEFELQSCYYVHFSRMMVK